MASEQPITLVHTDSGMCLTTEQFGGLRSLQEAFSDYKTSVGPFEVDELLEYLAIEYPRGAPFRSGGVRRVARRSNAYSWAPSDSLPLGDGLRLGTTRGDSLRLAIAGYQFPDAETPEERFSWYVVNGSATQAGRSWDFTWPALTCDAAPLICGWLFAVADWVGTEPDSDPPIAPWLVEPNVQFGAVRSEVGRAVFTVELNAEFLPGSSRSRTAEPAVLYLSATAEEVRLAAIDFAATVSRFPEVGASLPVRATRAHLDEAQQRGS